MNGRTQWVARIESKEAPALGALRLHPDLEIAALAHILWLRGAPWTEALELALRKVPGLVRFDLLPEGKLLPQGARVPDGRLPELRWQPLKDWLAIRLPAASTAAEVVARAPVALARSAGERPANALLMELASWVSFATQAPEVRLCALRFAAAVDGRVWIEGEPLPALPGERYHLRDGVAAPCGYGWTPSLESGVLRRWLGLAKGDSAFALLDGTWEVIRQEQFVSASRSAARLSANPLHA